MIDLPGPKVLRFTEEEVRTIAKYYKDEDTEGVDWLTTFVQRTYPDMHIVTTITDMKSNCVYVILTRRVVITAHEWRVDEEGNRYMDEWIEEYKLP